MNRIVEDYSAPEGPTSWDRAATGRGYGRYAGLGYPKKPVDPVKSARSKAAAAKLTPEERSARSHKAQATRRANEAKRQAELDVQHRAAYAQYEKDLEAKLGRKPDIFDMLAEDDDDLLTS